MWNFENMAQYAAKNEPISIGMLLIKHGPEIAMNSHSKAIDTTGWFSQIYPYSTALKFQPSTITNKP